MPDSPLVLDPTLLEQVALAAEKTNLEPTEWVHRALSYVLTHRVKLITVEAPPPTGCPHPKKSRQQMGWGTMCLDCNERVS